MEQHAPIPWLVKDGVCKHDHPDTSADVVGSDGRFIADCGCGDNAKATARLIVRAVNAHADLVAALRGELSASRSDCNDRKCGACSRCRSYAALAKAESK